MKSNQETNTLFPENFTVLEKEKLMILYKLQIAAKNDSPTLRAQLETNQQLTLERFQRGMDEIKQGNQEEGKVKIIQALTKFHLYNLLLTDEQLKAAEDIGEDLYDYLNESRKTVVHHLLKKLGPMSAFKIILNYQTTSNQLVMDFISNCPQLMSEVNEDGNTLLHQLVLDKNLSGTKAYLSALFTVQATQSNIALDIDKKNKNGQTVLQLVLNAKVGEKHFFTPTKDLLFISQAVQQEMASTIILYANPSYSAAQVEQLALLNINVSDILLQQSELKAKALDDAGLSNSNQIKLSLDLAPNRNRYFTPQHTADEQANAAELLKNIREEMRGLSAEIQSLSTQIESKSNQYQKLRQRAALIESQLNTSKEPSKGFSII